MVLARHNLDCWGLRYLDGNLPCVAPEKNPLGVIRIMSKSTLKVLFALLLCTIVYYWKILLTHDYSILVAYEGLCQGYGFNSGSCRSGIEPCPFGILLHWQDIPLAERCRLQHFTRSISS